MAINLKTNLWLEVKDYLIIALGLLSYALGFKLFLVPHEITTGGTTGLGAVIFYATGWWKVEYTFFLGNAILMAFALKTLSWRFCVKTIYAIATLTVLLAGVEWLMQALWHNNPALFPAGFNERVGLPIPIENAFMSCVFGASMMGAGIGLVFLRNGSTGGTDVIAAIINKHRDISLGTLVLFSDIFIVSSSLLLPSGNFENLLYGYTTLIVVSAMLDFVINSGQQSVQFLIFSQQYDEIASAINELHRGVTVLNGTGWYTQQERHVLVVLAKKRESPTIFRIIQSIDPNAFVSQTLASGVFGYGFDKIKVKPKPAKPRTADPGKPRN